MNKNEFIQGLSLRCSELTAECRRQRAEIAELRETIDVLAAECERAGNVIGRAASPLIAGGLLDRAKDARAILAKARP